MINTHNIDCMEFMRNVPDKYYELAIVDPPYGIGICSNSFRQKQIQKNWDNEIPTYKYFDELMRVSKEQIIWGGNYFNLPPTQGFIIWDKKQPQNFSSAMCEYAWMSIQSPAKIFRLHVVTAESNKIHPTQKPVALYKWILTKYAKQGDKIFDSHGGSMSIAIACHDLNFDIDVCELDTEYYEQALKRLHAHQLQTKLF